MKNFNTRLVTLMMATALLAVGCGKDNGFEMKSNALGQSAGDVVLPIDGADGGAGAVGGVETNLVPFTPVSMAEFNSYVGVRPLNAPQNISLQVELEQAEPGKYAGALRISYTDNGQTYTGVFESGFGQNQKISGLSDSNILESEYNRWFKLNGKTVFSGFFQDNYGAIVLVVDNNVNQGDGQGTGTLSGSIYYKNFAQSYAAQSPYRKCWFLRSGPYACRAEEVINKNALYPGNGYRKLGTFSGLSTSLAFK